MSTRVAPVDLDAVRGAFGFTRSLEVVDYHPGASGTWRLRSGGVDTFALKILARPDDWSRTQIVRQAQLERAATDAGVAMPELVVPLRPDLGLCADAAGQLVEVHRWVDTLPGGEQTAPPTLHRWLGRTLAVLHSLIPLDRNDEAELARAYAVHPLADWSDWVEDAHRQRLTWAPLATELLDLIPGATVLIQSALAETTLPRCLTHRDVNPPNVLHTKDGPVLCDFGYAGPDIAWLEAVSTAASFGAPEILTAYLDSGGLLGPTSTMALARAVGSAANWLAFNMWLSLGHRDVSGEERQKATNRVPHICREVIDRVTHQEVSRQAILGVVDDYSTRSSDQDPAQS